MVQVSLVETKGSMCSSGTLSIAKLKRDSYRNSVIFLSEPRSGMMLDMVSMSQYEQTVKLSCIIGMQI